MKVFSFNEISLLMITFVNFVKPEALISVTPKRAPPDIVAVPSVIDDAIIPSFTYNPLFIETSLSVIKPPLIDKSSAIITL